MTIVSISLHPKFRQAQGNTQLQSQLFNNLEKKISALIAIPKPTSRTRAIRNGRDAHRSASHARTKTAKTRTAVLRMVKLGPRKPSNASAFRIRQTLCVLCVPCKAMAHLRLIPFPSFIIITLHSPFVFTSVCYLQCSSVSFPLAPCM